MAREVSSGELRIGDTIWWLAPEAEEERLRPLVERAQRAVEDGEGVLRSGRRTALHRLAAHGDEPALLVKTNYYGFGSSARRRLGRSKARRELAVASGLGARGIETPIPLAAGERRRRGRLEACFLLVPLVEGALDLEILEREGELAPAERHALAHALGALVRRMHDVGLAQDDLAPNNFLLRRRGTVELLPIDFERARLLRAVPARRRRLALAKLDRNLGSPRATLRLRFLLAYAGERRSAREWGSAVDVAAAVLAARDLARIRRSLRWGDRRYRPVAREGWRGWLRRDASLSPDLAFGGSPVARGASPTVEDRGRLWLWRGPVRRGRDARRLLATARLLWRRRLGPQPLGVLTDARETRLWLERGDGERLANAADAAAADVLRARLSALGRVTGGTLSAMVDPRGRAHLLDPDALEVGRRP